MRMTHHRVEEAPERIAGNHLQYADEVTSEKQKGAFRAPFYTGGSCRIRTCDQLIKSQLLYQLS